MNEIEKLSTDDLAMAIGSMLLDKVDEDTDATYNACMSVYKSRLTKDDGIGFIQDIKPWQDIKAYTTLQLAHILARLSIIASKNERAAIFRSVIIECMLYSGVGYDESPQL